MAKFCPDCGNKLEEDYCPNCGKIQTHSNSYGRDPEHTNAFIIAAFVIALLGVFSLTFNRILSVICCILAIIFACVSKAVSKGEKKLKNAGIIIAVIVLIINIALTFAAIKTVEALLGMFSDDTGIGTSEQADETEDSPLKLIEQDEKSSADSSKKTTKPKTSKKQTEKSSSGKKSSKSTESKSSKTTKSKSTQSKTTSKAKSSKKTAKKTQKTFYIGSTKAEVRKVMGAPSGINSYEYLGTEDWSYGFSRITFKNGVVSGYNDLDENLKLKKFATNGSYFSVGSSKNAVLKSMGTPSGISVYEYLETEDWSYGFSRVTFKNGVVSGYNDIDNNLRVR